MWDAIGKVLTSGNALPVLVFLAVIIITLILLVKSGILAVKTKHFRLGQAEKEREIIRRQVEAAHTFIMSLEEEITEAAAHRNKYFTKYVLERVYDKVIEWVIFNNISNSPMYVQDKQETLCNLVYTFPVGRVLRTQEFKKKMQNWTIELIARLVQTRELYDV